MRVTLLSYTPDGLNLLLRTKNTRLGFDNDPANWTDAQRAEHLDYMRDTIRSSWEFVDYVFQIEGVCRAFTHQLVRTRTGSYAQEAQRVVDPSGNGYMEPWSGYTNEVQESLYQEAMERSLEGYQELVRSGMPRQDARAVLPTGILTSIVAKYNLRALSEMGKLRLCTRTQGEYQDVFRAMRAEVVAVHPWAAEFIQVFCAEHGHCAFPRYGAKECPAYQHTIPQEQLLEVRAKINAFMTAERHEANPVAVNGKAM